MISVIFRVKDHFLPFWDSKLKTDISLPLTVIKFYICFRGIKYKGNITSLSVEHYVIRNAALETKTMLGILLAFLYGFKNLETILRAVTHGYYTLAVLSCSVVSDSL